MYFAVLEFGFVEEFEAVELGFAVELVLHEKPVVAAGFGVVVVVGLEVVAELVLYEKPVVVGLEVVAAVELELYEELVVVAGFEDVVAVAVGFETVPEQSVFAELELNVESVAAVVVVAAELEVVAE